MPSERFLRLPKEKQELIRKAAIEEFKRVPPEEVSINRIIKEAEISRGSFYTYFEDKSDMLGWIIGGQMRSHWNWFRETLLKEDGDIWAVFSQVFDHSIDQTLQADFLEIIGNLIMSRSFSEYFRQGLEEEGPPGGHAMRQSLRWLYENSREELRPEEFGSFASLFDMQQVALVINLKQYFCHSISRPEAKERYHRYLDILRFGACPERKET